MTSDYGKRFDCAQGKQGTGDDEPLQVGGEKTRPQRTEEVDSRQWE
jgi:hypothetical protein